MDIIYAPKGKAGEYADLAADLYTGCTHGCIYCYARYYTPDMFDKTATPRKNLIERLKNDVACLGPGCPEILLSFHADIYQPAEQELMLTRRSLTILRDANLPFTVLTKGGTRAIRDFDILAGYEKGRFGTTLIFSDQADADYWEPGAPAIADRIEAIHAAHARGIKPG